MSAKDFQRAGGVDRFPREPSPPQAPTKVEKVRAALDAHRTRQAERPLHEFADAFDQVPPDPPGENGLTTKLDLRLTEVEKASWFRFAEAHHLSVSELIREAVNDRVTTARFG